MTASLVRANAFDLPLAANSVDLIVTSPPYFSMRSYRDGGEHFDGQIGSEDTPQEFLEALWTVTAEMKRVLKPSGSIFVNLGDKFAGAGGHNNAGLSTAGSTLQGTKQQDRTGTGGGAARRAAQRDASRRQAPDRYNQSASFGEAEVPRKSLMGLPWRYAIGCMDRLGLCLREELIWDKPNGLPESAVDRCRRSHEQFFHLTKEPLYFSAVDEIREPSLWSDRDPRANPDRYDELSGSDYHGERQKDAERGNRTVSVAFNPLGKRPGSVWRIPSEPLRVPKDLGVEHFAAFPQEWPRRLILGWSPSAICLECGQGRAPTVAVEAIEDRRGRPQGREGDSLNGAHGPDGRSGEGYKATVAITGYSCGCLEATAPTRPAVVLDPFAGTGTVPMVARALGRYGIGMDLSGDYLKLARWRIFDSGHAAKSVSRTWGERQGVLA